MGVPEHLRAAFTKAEAQLFEVYPDCWPACVLFMRMQTQWDMVGTFAGVVPVGLKYPVLWGMMDRQGVDREVQAGLELDVRVMEAAWLDERALMREESKRD